MERAIFLKKEHHFLSTELYFEFCGFSKTLPFHSFGPAIRNNFILHIVLSGKGTYYVHDQQYQLKKGDMFLIRPGDSTFYRSDSEQPWTYAWLSFGGKAAEEVVQYSLFQDAFYTMVSSDCQKYIDLILQCFDYASNTIINELRLNELLFSFLETLLADGGTRTLSSTKKPSRLAIDALKFIRENYTNELTVQSVADHLSVNRSHLSRVFHESYGLSIKEWITGVRINRAAFLLSMTDDSVESIAYQAGFHSLVVFSRSFKAATGETPSHYRNRLTKENIDQPTLADIVQLLDSQDIVSRAT
ncbi:MAG: helix-turn-helix domain-containing protein [Enterococcus sp.]